MKKILITGASNGIGLAIARQLAVENQLTLVARNAEKLGQLVAELPGLGHQFLVADLSKKDDIHAIADHMESNHYDVLINNAGVGLYGRFEEIPLDRQMKMIQLNIYGLTVLSHSYLNTARRGDSLVNIGSSLGITSFAGAAAYAATKAFVSNFSESLWWENKERGVYVLGFSPGATYTNFHEGAGGKAEMFPKLVMQNAEQVAKELIRALEQRNKPRVVSGPMSRLMIFFHRFMSRKTAVNMMGGFSPIKKGKENLSAVAGL